MTRPLSVAARHAAAMTGECIQHVTAYVHDEARITPASRSDRQTMEAAHRGSLPSPRQVGADVAQNAQARTSRIRAAAGECTHLQRFSRPEESARCLYRTKDDRSRRHVVRRPGLVRDFLQKYPEDVTGRIGVPR